MTLNKKCDNDIQTSEKMSLRERQVEVVEITAQKRFQQLKNSNTVKTLKVYNAPIGEVCDECKKHVGRIVAVVDAELGINVPPFKTCKDTVGCRCFFTPCEMTPIRA